LQTIVFLIVLLVVGVVVIRIFIIRMSVTKGEIEEKIKNLDDFEIKCQKLCDEYKIDNSPEKLSEFCYTSMSGLDLNGNGAVDVLKAKTKLLDICEDAVYCFHVVDCVDWGDCRKATCEKDTEEYGNEDKAELKVNSLFNSGSCNLDVNWKDMYFGDRPCSFPPNSLRVRNCRYDGNKLECETNCFWRDGEEVMLVIVDDPTSGTPVTCSIHKSKDGSINPSGSSINFIDYVMTVEGLVCLQSLSGEKDNWTLTLVCTSLEENTAAIRGVG